MQWFLVPFLLVALLAVWLSRRRRVDPDDIRRDERARTAAEATRHDWLGGGGG